MSIQAEPSQQTITLKERADYWIAIHEETGVGAQGATRAAALDELDEAVALHTNDATEPVADEDAVLCELEIDPDEVNDNQPLPPFMQIQGEYSRLQTGDESDMAGVRPHSNTWYEFLPLRF